jgi:MFS family permease
MKLAIIQGNKLLNGLKQSPVIVKVLVAQQFLEGFVPIMALYAIMFERVGGLSLQQIGWLFSIWSIGYLIAELPSGVLADYWSRRNVIALGGLLRAIGFVIWMVWPTFTGYAIGFALWGFTIACASGAVPAYLHNELKADGKERQFAKYFGWVMSALSVGMLAGYGLAAFLTLQHTSILIGISVASSVAFTLLLLVAKERPYNRRATYLKTLKAGLAEIRSSKRLRYICYVLFSIYMTLGVIEELLPRLYAGFGLNDSAVSWVLAISLLATIFFLTRMEVFVRFSLAKQSLLMCAATGFLLVGLGIGGVGAVALLMFFNLVFHLFRSVFIHHTQEVTESDEKATIASIPGLAGGLFGALAYVIIGAVAETHSERFSIGAYGLFWLMSFIALAYLGRKYVIRHAQPVVPQGETTLYDGQK